MSNETQAAQAAVIASQLVQGDTSVTRGLFNQPTMADVLTFCYAIRDAIPKAIETAQAYAKDDAEAAAARLGLDEAATSDYVAVKLSLVPTKAAIESRLNQAIRAAISRWHTGKSARPVWFDDSLSLSFTDGFNWVPKPVRNQAAAQAKKAEAEAAKKAEILATAEAAAAVMLNDSEAVQAAAAAQAAAQVQAAQAEAEAAQSKAAAAVNDKMTAQAAAQKAADKIAELQAENTRLRSELATWKRQNRVLQAALKDKRVVSEAADIIMGKIEAEAAAV